MEIDMLVLVLDPEDPHVFDLRQPATDKPKFGIVRDLLDHEGVYRNFRCGVMLDNGVYSILRVGQLIPLLGLPVEDAENMSPTESFEKWAAEIVRRHAIACLTEGDRYYLFSLLPAAP